MTGTPTTLTLAILLIIFMVLIAFTQQTSFTETFLSCYGRSHGACLSDINCEWDAYYDACQPRSYNAWPGWGWGWGWGRPWGWGRRGQGWRRGTCPGCRRPGWRRGRRWF